MARNSNWNLKSNDDDEYSLSDATKFAYELRILGLLLHAIETHEPIKVLKRESPDFEVITHSGTWWIEVVDAIPDAFAVSSLSSPNRMNLAKRR